MIALYSLWSPITRRLEDEIPIVTQFVANFNKLGLSATFTGFLDLFFFSFILRQIFIIRAFQYNILNFGSKLLLKFFRSCFSVFNSVMEKSSTKNIIICNPCLCQDVGDLDWMVDVGNVSILSPLAGMLPGSKLESSGEEGYPKFPIHKKLSIMYLMIFALSSECSYYFP